MPLYDYDEMMKHAKNKFHLVNILAKRAAELNRWPGANTSIHKIIPIVIEELLEGKLDGKYSEKFPPSGNKDKEEDKEGINGD